MPAFTCWITGGSSGKPTSTPFMSIESSSKDTTNCLPPKDRPPRDPPSEARRRRWTAPNPMIKAPRPAHPSCFLGQSRGDDSAGSMNLKRDRGQAPPPWPVGLKAMFSGKLRTFQGVSLGEIPLPPEAERAGERADRALLCPPGLDQIEEGRSGGHRKMSLACRAQVLKRSPAPRLKPGSRLIWAGISARVYWEVVRECHFVISNGA